MKRHQIKLLSFNVWGAGLNEGKSVDETLAVLRAVQADVIGLQEVRAEWGDRNQGSSTAKALALALGYYVFEQSTSTPWSRHNKIDSSALWDNAILSRYPILHPVGDRLGVALDLGAGQIAYAFNVHLCDDPYQPYQFTGIEYSDSSPIHTADEGVVEAARARGDAVEDLMNAIASVRREQTLIFVFGDFNEPSSLDWSERAAAEGLSPVPVPFPASSRLLAANFCDTFRTVWNDEVMTPGQTFRAKQTMYEKNQEERDDRIDFVYACGPDLQVETSTIFGESGSPSVQRVVMPWPSDHRAVASTVSFQ